MEACLRFSLGPETGVDTPQSRENYRVRYHYHELEEHKEIIAEVYLKTDYNEAVEEAQKNFKDELHSTPVEEFKFYVFVNDHANNGRRTKVHIPMAEWSRIAGNMPHLRDIYIEVRSERTWSRVTDQFRRATGESSRQSYSWQ